MKLYYYSHEQCSIVEARWVPLSFMAGVLVFAILILAAMKLNDSMGFAFESSSVGPLTVENGILQRQVHLLSPRVRALETNVRMFRGRFDNFNAVLRGDEALRVKARFPAPPATSFVSGVSGVSGVSRVSVRSPVLAKRN